MAEFNLWKLRHRSVVGPQRHYYCDPDRISFVR
jgi:hypothetical protein